MNRYDFWPGRVLRSEVKNYLFSCDFASSVETDSRVISWRKVSWRSRPSRDVSGNGNCRRCHNDFLDFRTLGGVKHPLRAFDGWRENALISLAQVAIDQNNYERALQVLNDVVRSNPTRSDLRRNIESLENLVLLQTDN